ncbi:hypothetical protein H4S06_001381, partial [Coemansia sp. BCRC 34490]
ALSITLFTVRTTHRMRLLCWSWMSCTSSVLLSLLRRCQRTSHVRRSPDSSTYAYSSLYF